MRNNGCLQSCLEQAAHCGGVRTPFVELFEERSRNTQSRTGFDSFVEQQAVEKEVEAIGMKAVYKQLESDEGFFSTETEVEEKDKPVKRGRGSQEKSKALVMAESQPVKGQTV
jgi:hypothetical protein